MPNKHNVLFNGSLIRLNKSTHSDLNYKQNLYFQICLIDVSHLYYKLDTSIIQ